MTQYRILHFLDYFLPETMNWLEELLQSSAPNCYHILCFKYLDPCKYLAFERLPFIGILTNVPLTLKDKILSKVQILLYSNKLMHFIINNDIDLLHFHFGNVAIEYRAIILSKIKPCVISLYGYDYEYLVYRKPKTKGWYRKFAESGAHFIVEGHYSQQLLSAYQIPKERIHILQMLFYRKHVSSFIYFNRPIRLIQVATFTEKKGQLVLLQAFLLCKNRDQFVLDFYGEIGDQVYFQELKHFIKMNALHNVRLHSKLSVKDYLHVLSHSHIAVNLSMRSKVLDTEGGCPVFLKDALVLGKPIFSTYHCDIPEIGVSFYNGWLVKENNITETVKMLDFIAQLSMHEYQKYTFNALESVKCKWNDNQTGQKLVKTYNNILNENRFI